MLIEPDEDVFDSLKPVENELPEGTHDNGPYDGSKCFSLWALAT